MALSVGTLLIYHGRSAAVAALNGDKIEIRAEDGKSRSVRPKDVEFLHRGPVAGLPPRTLPPPDCRELLELMESETLPFAEFCRLAYSADSPEAAWSAWQLIGENVYFSGSPADGVRARSAAEIEQTLAALAAKHQAGQARAELLERIRAGRLLPEDAGAIREIEQVALGKSANSRLLRELGIEAEPVKAHALLIKLGVWDWFVNPWPDRFGVELDDPDFPLPALPDEQRLDLTHLAAFAIDDADSHDPDDAISFVDGLLWVHVADPTAVIAPESEIDREARRRGANLYLPEKISHMLPTAFTHRFGLGLNPESPAISFAVKFSADGEAELAQLTLSTIRVTRLDYDGAMAHLTEAPLAEIAEKLTAFRRRRLENGALLIDLPEVKVKVADRQVVITELAANTVRELVANAMLAAGAAVGRWAAEREMPMPFAVQPPAETVDGLDTLPGMFAQRRNCAPSLLVSFPGRHAGLGLEPYVRVTSPLRRYGDLLAHMQLRRHLAGQTLWSADELDRLIAESEAGGAERRKLERQSNEFWKLVYFKQHEDWTGEGVPVFRQDDRTTYLVPSLAYEFKNRFNGDIRLGEPVKLRLNAVDPATMTCRLLVGGEAQG
jgi:exoribonuclease-2